MNKNLKIRIEESLHSQDEGALIDLSQEKLSITDYEWLAEIISKSSVVETIRLPPISKEEAEEVISILNKATIKNSTLIDMDINIKDDHEQYSKYTLALRQQIQSRLERNRKKIFAIHGGGNIGLGLMAYIVSQSPFDYRITATSNNSFSNDLINSRNKLWLQHDPSNLDDATCVTNVTMITRDSPDIIRLYNEATIAALCVTPAVLPNIAKDIAKALINRFKIDGSGLKILVLMNIPDCAAFVREKIYSEILLATENEVTAKEIISVVEFVPTVIDRIVTPISEEIIKLQLNKQLEKVDKEKLIYHLDEDNIDHILSSPEKLKKAVSVFNLQFNLFNAEKSFTMYAHKCFMEAHHFPLIKISSDLSVIEAVKNKYINGPHAILAWVGTLLGFDTIAESIKHPELFAFIKEMMEQEIGPILCAEYPELTNKDLEMFELTFLERCKASTNDPNSRVGRDPLRKLNCGERVRGPLELVEKHDLKISTARLEQGLAAGILYGVKFDPSNPGCQKIREIYNENNHSFRAVLCYNGEAPSGTFTGLTPNKDEKIIDNVMSHIKYFNWLYERRTTAKPKSSTAFVLSKQSVSHTLVSKPNTLYGLFGSLKKEKNVEHQPSQMVVCVPNNNLYIYHDHKKFKYCIWYQEKKKSKSTDQPKNYLRISNS